MHHDVEIAGNLEHPVELRQRIMEVGYQEEAHGRDPRAWIHLWRDGFA